MCSLDNPLMVNARKLVGRMYNEVSNPNWIMFKDSMLNKNDLIEIYWSNCTVSETKWKNDVVWSGYVAPVFWRYKK